jgi:hypothetical protein
MKTIGVTLYSIAERFIGMKEVDGKLANPAILAMLQLDDTWPQDDEVPWCFTGNVAILTAAGFRRFDALADDDLVAQVDPARRISYTRPLRVIRKSYSGILANIKTPQFDLVCDPEHRFLGIWNRANDTAGPIELRPIKDLTSGLFIPSVSTAIKKDDPEWSKRDIALFAAFISDGCFHHGRLSMQVSRERKIDLLPTLNPANIYQAPRAYGRSTKALTTFEYEIPVAFEGAFSDYKMPDWGLLRRWSQSQLDHFVHTYAMFDGHTRGGSIYLYTSEPTLRDWLQVAVTLAGYHSSHRVSSISPFSGRPCDEIVFSPGKRTRTIRPSALSFHDQQNTDLFCVEVPTGAIVIRDPSGTVIPVGNCSAALNYWAWLLRLPRSKSLRARSWLEVGTPVSEMDVEVGFDVVVLKRGASDAGPETINAPGHVGLYAGTMPLDSDVLILGGNQSNKVSVAAFSASRILGIRRLF